MEMMLTNNLNTMVMTNNKKDRKQKTVTEKQEQAWRNQIKYIDTSCKNNEIYWNEFSAFKFPLDKQKMSMSQYKSSIFNFIRYIGKGKDLCSVTREDIDNFVADADNPNTIQNKIAHIKSILTYIVQNNTANCLDRISKDTLILIIQL